MVIGEVLPYFCRAPFSECVNAVIDLIDLSDAFNHSVSLNGFTDHLTVAEPVASGFVDQEIFNVLDSDIRATVGKKILVAVQTSAITAAGTMSAFSWFSFSKQTSFRCLCVYKIYP